MPLINLKTLVRLCSKNPARPQPIYPYIKGSDIPKASIFLFYGVNKITEVVGNKAYQHPFRPCSGHASVGLGGTLTKNINKQSTEKDISDDRASTQRVDVLIRTDMSDAEREIVCKKSRENLKANKYDVAGYAHFGVILFPWMEKLIVPSENREFCSDDVVDSFVGTRKVSYHDGEHTAPWHLLEYALENLSLYDIRTYHVGKDFAKKYQG